MTIAEKVKEFLSYYVKIPPDQIPDDLDVVNDVDWSHVHPDEEALFFVDFIDKFNILNRETNFRYNVKKNSVPWYLIPIFFVKFYYFTATSTVYRLTVADMIRMTEKGEWDI